jgi:hypothetical protein
MTGITIEAVAIVALLAGLLRPVAADGFERTSGRTAVSRQAIAIVTELG